MRVVFAGTPEFALPALEMLLAAPRVEVAGVFTQPPRAAGRGRKLRASAVAELMRAHSAPVFTPENFDAHAQTALQKLRSDLLVTAAYGLLLPAGALAAARLGGVNLHASLLPRWRGAAPVERAIEAGDAETGVTLMQMDARLDRGAMLARARVGIDDFDTGGSLREKLARAAAKLLRENLDALAERALPPQPQDERAATYARKLHAREAAIDWRASAAQLARRVRAFQPWPVAHAELNGVRLRVLRARVAGVVSAGEVSNAAPEVSRAAPGEVLSATRDGITVATADGALQLCELQKPGGAPMSAAALLNGMRISRGMRFACAEVAA